MNQFAIFFRVIGREFDELKGMIFRVREEANVVSASEVMLPVHGQDRNMPRLAGESVEGYRTRLAMKGIISEWGGTRQGILYVLAALGYEQAQIIPMGPQDPEHWAEFIADLGVGNKNAIRDTRKIYDEIQTVKEGSSRLAGIIISSETFHTPLPITPHLCPRVSVSTLPPPRRGPLSVQLRTGPVLGARISTVTLPMAAAPKGV